MVTLDSRGFGRTLASGAATAAGLPGAADRAAAMHAALATSREHEPT